MTAVIALCFFVILALLLFSISFGLRFYESRRRSKLVSMLRTVTENGEERHVNLLIDADAKQDTIESLFGSANITGRITTRLSESGLGWTLTRFAVTSGVACLVGTMAGFLAPMSSIPPLWRALGAGLCAAFLPFLYVSKKRSARLGELESQLPDALDFLSRSMRAGHAFTITLEMVGQEIHEPLGQEFRTLFNEQNLGASLERSLANFGKRVPLSDVQFFTSAVLLQRQTGGNLSEILNRLSHIIRERFQLKGKIKAVSAHGRMTATILTLLPIATLGGLILTSPGYLDPLLHDPTGHKLVAAGVMAQVLGNFCIQKIIKIEI